MDKVCKQCKQIITPEYQEIINQRKRDNALNSLRKAKENGNKLGPKRRVSIEKVMQYRAAGKSFRQIGKEMGFSSTAVYRAYLKGN